jgi:hypothetical protein
MLSKKPNWNKETIGFEPKIRQDADYLEKRHVAKGVNDGVHAKTMITSEQQREGLNTETINEKSKDIRLRKQYSVSSSSDYEPVYKHKSPQQSYSKQQISSKSSSF